jgi:hypothetical protein
MKLLSVLAATAAAAAVAAVLTLPAGANQASRPDPKAAAISACLRSHGATDVPSGADALALKQWIAAHPDDPAVGTCLPQSQAPAGLMDCLRAHGLNPPSNLMELKPWMAQQDGTDAGRTALRACGVDMTPPDKGPAPDCGGGGRAKPANPADKQPELSRS